MKFLPQKKVKHCYKELIVTTSWDDGTASDIKLAQLIEKYSLKATFYVTKSYTYLEDTLAIDDVIELDEKHEIGAHTLTHPDLDKISIEKATDEIVDSKEYLKSILGHNVEMFCYPRGKYNNQIISIVKNAGFLGARTCDIDNFCGNDKTHQCTVTLQASNGSPLQTLSLCLSNRLSMKSVMNWDVRAKELFDHYSEIGGVYHLWGHAAEISKNNEWDKLEGVFQYIANRPNVKYLTNGDVLRYITEA